MTDTLQTVARAILQSPYYLGLAGRIFSTAMPTKTTYTKLTTIDTVLWTNTLKKLIARHSSTSFGAAMAQA